MDPISQCVSQVRQPPEKSDDIRRIEEIGKPIHRFPRMGASRPRFQFGSDTSSARASASEPMFETPLTGDKSREKGVDNPLTIPGWSAFANIRSEPNEQVRGAEGQV